MLGGESMGRLPKIVRVEVELTDSENCNVSVDSRKVEVEVYSEVEK